MEPGCREILNMCEWEIQTVCRCRAVSSNAGFGNIGNSSYHDIIGKRFCSIVTYFVLTKVMLKNDCIEFLLNIYFQVVVQLSPLTRDGFHANNFTLSENMIKNLLI